MQHTFQGFMFPFLFNRSQLKAGVVNQMSHFYFRKISTIGQLNVQAPTSENVKIINLE